MCQTESTIVLSHASELSRQALAMLKHRVHDSSPLAHNDGLAAFPWSLGNFICAGEYVSCMFAHVSEQTQQANFGKRAVLTFPTRGELSRGEGGFNGDEDLQQIRLYEVVQRLHGVQDWAKPQLERGLCHLHVDVFKANQTQLDVGGLQYLRA